MTTPMDASLDRLTAAFDRLAERLETLEANRGALSGDADRMSHHVRRYLPFYALAAAFAVFLVMLPTRGPDPTRTDARELTPGASSEEAEPGAGDDGTTDRSTDGPASSRVPGVVAGPTGSTTDRPGRPSESLDPLAWTATGKTVGGFECKKGIRQIPWSSYAVPCYPRWSGNNGGATTRGVSAKEIVIVNRTFPESADSQALEAILLGAGVATSETTRAARNEFLKFFNKVFELWGRKVKIIDWESQFGNQTDEQLGGGKEGACADANIIVNEIKAFGVVGGSAPFSECAATKKLVVFGGAGHYPESWYAKRHPYIWHLVTECERAFTQAAEYIGKRLHNRPAKWAKGLEKGKSRRFAMYIPSNDGYQSCANLLEREFKNKYGGKLAARFNYSLDISRVADESARAITQFKASGATSIILSCDAISPIFLTQNAKGQSYYPEWVLIGVALTDLDIAGRVYDQDEVRGSLFGMSQLGANEKIFGPKGEMPRTYKAATGTTIPEGTDGNYFALMPIFTFLQAAGPRLTPHTLADGIQGLPPGGAPGFAAGGWSWQEGSTGKAGAKDHTGVDDSREIYFDVNRTGYDGKKGAYAETNGGKRYGFGEWPREEPKVYPGS